MSHPDLRFENGSHISQIYETFDEQKEVILPFVSEGLRNGEFCLLVANDGAWEAWRRELRAYGIDVEHEMSTGSLSFATGAQWRGAGPLNSVHLARQSLNLIRDLSGFKGIRMAGDVEWHLNPELLSDQLCHWEATANLVFEGQPVQTICQFNRKSYGDSAIYAVLRTHPIVIYEGRTYRNNPNYEASRILENEPDLNHSDADAHLVEAALARLSP